MWTAAARRAPLLARRARSIAAPSAGLPAFSGRINSFKRPKKGVKPEVKPQSTTSAYIARIRAAMLEARRAKAPVQQRRVKSANRKAR